MNSMRVPVFVISEQARDQYLETGYNPPPSGYDEDQFDEEFQRARRVWESAVGLYWTSGIEDDADCFIDAETPNDRFLCIEVSKEEILSPTLLIVVHGIVCKVEPAYAVDICDAFNVLRTADDDFYPEFNIIIEKSRILVYSESPAVLKKLGVWHSSKGSSKGVGSLYLDSTGETW